MCIRDSLYRVRTRFAVRFGADTQLFLIESAEGYWRNEQHYGICRRRRTAAALYPAADALSGTTPRNGEIDLKIKPYENHVSGALR